mgnify:CR=1 FL=1
MIRTQRYESRLVGVLGNYHNPGVTRTPGICDGKGAVVHVLICNNSKRKHEFKKKEENKVVLLNVLQPSMSSFSPSPNKTSSRSR